jgi:1-phosphatidylinositol-5-phosphate 4-kinase
MSTAITKHKGKHIKAVRQKLRLFRAKEPLLSVFMWGINHSINELSHIKMPAMLMPDDFKAHSKIRVDNHLFNKENMPSHFKFKEYCPMVFRNLRERFYVDDEAYMDSLTKECPNDQDSPGRSGARFLESYDTKYVVKTIGSEEVAEMHRILKDYHQFVVERHAKTLLPHFMGMYRVTVNDNETYLVVMKNIFSPRLNVHKKYDLKGSTVSREASDKEKAKELPTFKDNDFINEGIKIDVGDEPKEELINMLQADVDFLTKMNLMDYSLLIGIHDVELAEQEDEAAKNEEADLQEEAEENGVGGDNAAEDADASANPLAAGTPPDSPLAMPFAPAFEGEFDTSFEQFAYMCSDKCPRKEIYFMAIIDILTHYGMKKRTAQAAKTMKHGAGAEISTVRPDQYAKRFMEFIEKILI